MCLALPARIVELIDADAAVVDMGGVRKRISIALVPEAAMGDYVIVHVGHAIGMLDVAEAMASLALFAELAHSQRGSDAAIA
jgi:hydrogenase expression/formation protein HypC